MPAKKSNLIGKAKNWMQELKTMFVKRLDEKEEDESVIWRKLIVGISGTFGLKIAFTLFSLIYTFLLARILLTAQYGTFVYAKNWINLLLVLAIFGFAPLLVREVAAYKVSSSWSLMHGLIKWTHKYVLLFSVGLSVMTILVFLAINRALDSLFYTLLIALILLPVVTSIRLKKAVMQGLHRVVKGQMPEMIVLPVSFIILICLSYLFFRDSLNSIWAMSLYVFSSLLALTLASFQLKKYLPDKAKNALPQTKPNIWLLSALPLVIVDGAFVINSRADILILGGLKGSYWTGVYAIPCHVAGLITFILIAVNYALGPTISQLWASGNISKLQKMITKSARLAFFFRCPSPFALFYSANGYYPFSAQIIPRV